MECGALTIAIYANYRMCLLIQICGEGRHRKFKPKQCIVYEEEKCEVHWTVGQERLFFGGRKGEVVLREAKTTRAELFSFAKSSDRARSPTARGYFTICGFVDQKR